MKKELSEKFKYWGFIMTCGMILYHSPLIETLASRGPIDHLAKITIDSIFMTSVNLLMSYFFAVTGFLLFRNFSMKGFPAKIKKRVFSLLVPFVLWQLIFWAINAVTGFGPITTFTEFLKRTFLLEKWPVDAALWYVYAIFILALLSPLVFVIIRKKTLGWGFIIFVALLAQVRYKIDIPAFKAVIQYGYIENIVHFSPAYFAGAFFGYHYKDSSADCLSRLVPTLMIAFLLSNMIEGFFSDISFKLLPIAIIYLLPPIHVLENRKIYKLSFLMYALHQPFIWITSPALIDFYTNHIYQLIPSAAIASITIRIVLLAMVTGLAALIHLVFSRLSPRFLAMLSGGRA